MKVELKPCTENPGVPLSEMKTNSFAVVAWADSDSVWKVGMVVYRPVRSVDGVCEFRTGTWSFVDHSCIRVTPCKPGDVIQFTI